MNIHVFYSKIRTKQRFMYSKMINATHVHKDIHKQTDGSKRKCKFHFSWPTIAVHPTRTTWIQYHLCSDSRIYLHTQRIHCTIYTHTHTHVHAHRHTYTDTPAIKQASKHSLVKYTNNRIFRSFGSPFHIFVYNIYMYR